MGNTITKEKNYDTENFSSEIPQFPYANIKEMRKLSLNLDLLNTDTNTEKSNSPVFMQKYKIDSKDNFSDTSPFITSDMYKVLANNENMQGGGINDNSSTTTTSVFKQIINALLNSAPL